MSPSRVVGTYWHLPNSWHSEMRCRWCALSESSEESTRNREIASFGLVLPWTGTLIALVESGDVAPVLH